MDHTDAIEALDRLHREYMILQQMREKVITDADLETHATLVLQQAKRVRSASTIAVRALARLRDSYSPEGTSE